jgi:hypothetical protein
MWEKIVSNGSFFIIWTKKKKVQNWILLQRQSVVGQIFHVLLLLYFVWQNVESRIEVESCYKKLKYWSRKF